MKLREWPEIFSTGQRFPTPQRSSNAAQIRPRHDAFRCCCCTLGCNNVAAIFAWPCRYQDASANDGIGPDPEPKPVGLQDFGRTRRRRYRRPSACVLRWRTIRFPMVNPRRDVASPRWKKTCGRFESVGGWKAVQRTNPFQKIPLPACNMANVRALTGKKNRRAGILLSTLVVANPSPGATGRKSVRASRVGSTDVLDIVGRHSEKNCTRFRKSTR